jgi:hypothetical protein
MPVIARFCGIVVRLLWLRAFGTRLHAFYGDSEMVVDLRTLRVVEGTLPDARRSLFLMWAQDHQQELLAGHWAALPGAITPALASAPPCAAL